MLMSIYTIISSWVSNRNPFYFVKFVRKIKFFVTKVLYLKLFQNVGNIFLQKGIKFIRYNLELMKNCAILIKYIIMLILQRVGREWYLAHVLLTQFSAKIAMIILFIYWLNAVKQRSKEIPSCTHAVCCYHSNQLLYQRQCTNAGRRNGKRLF